MIIDSTAENSCKYWLDFKNLTVENAPKVVQLLDSIALKHNGIKSRIIIESNIPKALDILSKQGYYTSYWVPHYENNIMGFIKFFIRTKPNLIRYRINALSAQQRMLPMLEMFYSNHHFHIWTDDYGNDQMLPKIKELSKNKSVDIILVDYKTPPPYRDWETFFEIGRAHV